MIGLAVGALGAARLVDVAVEVRAGVTVVVGADVHVLLHHLVFRLQGPDAVLAAAAQPGERTQRQFDVELVGARGVVEFDDVDTQAFVAGEAVPDADFGQQPGNEGQVAFAVLHHLLAPGVFAVQVEEEVPAPEIVATAQDVLDDFRHRPVLVDPVLPAPREQRQTRLQGDFVARLVDGTGQAFEASDHPVQGAQRLDLGRLEDQRRDLFR